MSFTKDTSALRAAVSSITDADGISTNLYGALEEGYSLWSDGFYQYDSTATAPQLVAGLMIAVSDGNDTAGISMLPDVVTARGTKRTIFIRVGQDLDRSIAEEQPMLSAECGDSVPNLAGDCGAAQYPEHCAEQHDVWLGCLVESMTIDPETWQCQTFEGLATMYTCLDEGSCMLQYEDLVYCAEQQQ